MNSRAQPICLKIKAPEDGQLYCQGIHMQRLQGSEQLQLTVISPVKP